MKFLVLLGLVLGAAGSLVADDAPLKSFHGSYRKAGRLIVNDGSKVVARGKARISFTSTPEGTSELRITGKMRVDGFVRPVHATIVFASDHAVALSNLAPGLDDGHAADDGAYRAGSRNIRAEVPFKIGTTTGSADLSITRFPNAKSPRIRVIQTLASTALSSVITWRFQAAAGR